jgi:hypothetical protein
MLLLSHVDNVNNNGGHIDCISWARDGHTFLIRDKKELVDNLAPLFFREGKFSSFTRKLYRWGFRQICIPKGLDKKDREMVFGHEHFQRDNKAIMSYMRSVTAAGTRRAISALTSRKKAREQSQNAKIEELSDSQPRNKSPSLPRNKVGDTTIKSLVLPQPKKAEPPTSLRSAIEQLKPAHQGPSSGMASTPIGSLVKSKMFPPGQGGMPSQQGQMHGLTPPSGSVLDELFKAKSHSLMAPPAQDNMMMLKNSTALQSQMDYLKAIAQSAGTSSTSSLRPSNFSFGAKTSFGNLQHLSSSNSNMASQAHATARNLVFSDAQLQQIVNQHTLASHQHASPPSPSLALRNAQLSQLASNGNMTSQARAARMVPSDAQLQQIAGSGNLASQARAFAMLRQIANPVSYGSRKRAVSSPSLIPPEP